MSCAAWPSSDGIGPVTVPSRSVMLPERLRRPGRWPPGRPGSGRRSARRRRRRGRRSGRNRARSAAPGPGSTPRRRAATTRSGCPADGEPGRQGSGGARQHQPEDEDDPLEPSVAHPGCERSAHGGDLRSLLVPALTTRQDPRGGTLAMGAPGCHGLWSGRSDGAPGGAGGTWRCGNLLRRSSRGPGFPVVHGTRAVAQLGSAPDWGSGGRRFKSCQPDNLHSQGVVPGAHDRRSGGDHPRAGSVGGRWRVGLRVPPNDRGRSRCRASDSSDEAIARRPDRVGGSSRQRSAARSDRAPATRQPAGSRLRAASPVCDRSARS